MTVPSEVGTRTEISESIDNNSQSITIPTDAEICIVHVVYWQGSDADRGLDPGTDIGGASFSSIEHDNLGNSWHNEVLRADVSALSGSQTFTWNRTGSGSVSNGGQMVVSFWKDVDQATTNGIRASGTDDDNAGTDSSLSVTLSSDTNDLVLGFCAGTDSSDPTDMSPVSSGQIDLYTGGDFGSMAAYAGIEPGASSVEFITADAVYNSMAVISLRGSVVASVGHPTMRRWGGTPGMTPGAYQGGRSW